MTVNEIHKSVVRCQMSKVAVKSRAGFTILELIVVAGITIVLGVVGIANFTGLREKRALNDAAVKIAADLKDTISKAVAGEGDSAWGIRFTNGGSDYYEIWRGAGYATGTVVRRVNLESGVSFSDPAEGQYKDVAFSLGKGSPTITNASGPDTSTVGLSNVSGDQTITITPIGRIDVKANAGQTASLTVTKSGSGTGTVTSSPAGISCGFDCSEDFSLDTNVSLTATADGGSTFRGWTGDCSGTGSCDLIMSGDRSVTATFDPPPDIAAPSGTISINNGASTTSSTSVTLTLSCSDSESGCSQMQFSNDNATYSALETYSTSKAWTLTSGDGTKTVYVKYKDAAGNLSSAFSDTITLDAVAPPTLSSPTHSSITSDGATLGATVSSDGGAVLTARGTCWGTSPAPTTNCLAEGGTATGIFSHARTGMPSATLIYYRGYATNSEGTGYSPDGSFTTASATTVPGAPTGLSATAGDAQVSLSWSAPTSDGGSAITSYKVYRGTVSGSLSFLTSGGCSGLGNVLTCTDTGLNNGTTYYYQVSAVNVVGEGTRSSEASATPEGVLIGLFWIGGTGNWNDGTHWSTSSGGSACSCVPTSTDNVYFDANSFTATGQTVTVNVSASARNMDWTGVINNPTWAGSQSLNLSGSLKLSAGMTRTYTGAITFSATTTGHTLTFNGINLASSVTFNGAGGSWILQDEWNNGSEDIILTAGTLDTNSKTVSCNSFNISGSNTRALILRGSTINLSGFIGWNASAITNLTFSADTSTINIGTSGGSTMPNFYGGGLTYHNVVWGFQANTLTPASMTGANKFLNLTINSGTVGHYMFGANQEITGTLTIAGSSSTNRVMVQSSVKGVQRTLTAATVSVSNADFQDILGAGAGSWDLSATIGGSGDAGGNSGIIFTPSATQYWKTSTTGTKYWSDVGNWFLATNGGGGSGRVPLPQDDVVFDASSIGATGTTIVQNMRRAGRSINWTGVTNLPTWETSTTSAIFGSLILVSDMTLNASTATYVFEGRGSFTIDMAGKTFEKPIIINAPGGTLALASNMTLGSTRRLTITSGTLTVVNGTNNYIISTGQLTLNGGTLTLGTNTHLITGTGTTTWNVTSGTLNAGSSTIKITSTSNTAITFVGGGKTYNNLEFAGTGTGALTIQSSNTFNNLTISSAPKSVNLTSGTIQTINGTFTANGSSGSLITLRSTTAGSQSTISAAAISLSYVDVQDSNATGVASPFACDSTCVNSGNNTGWSFATPPTLSSPTHSSISSSGATLGANVTSNGGAVLTARGTCWGTSPAPTTNCLAEGGTATGIFSHARTGMPSATLIYYRGYATNSEGTGYSPDGSFTTDSFSFIYRRDVAINNSSNSLALSDFQIAIPLDTAALINAAKIRSDCGDIRVKDTDNAIYLSYWLDVCNSSASKIWVKVPSIPGSSSKTIYIHYGNSAALSEANGNNVFEFFDNFSGSVIDSTKWGSFNNGGGSGSASISNGELRLSAGSGASSVPNIKTISNFGSGIWEGKARIVTASTSHLMFIFRDTVQHALRAGIYNDHYIYDGTLTSELYEDIDLLLHTYFMRVKFIGTSMIEAYVSNLTTGTSTNTIDSRTVSGTNGPVGLAVWSSGVTAAYDDVRVRKIPSSGPEPTVTVGLEVPNL